jgi:predicted ATPase
MLARVYIDNFRSFVNFEYQPEQKQLLLGPNGSGKSSLLEAIRYIKMFVDGRDNPFTQSTRTRWQDRSLQTVEIGALLDSKRYVYRLEIRFDPDSRRVTVPLEGLKVDGSAVFEKANGEIRFFLSDGKDSDGVPIETTQSVLHLAQLSNPYVHRFVEWLEKSVHCFDIDPYPGQFDEISDGEEELPDYELENLAAWYRHLVQSYPDENLRFLNSLRGAMSGFQTLRFSSEEDGARKLRAEFTVSGSQRVRYSLAELSLGQRYLIGLYMILHFAIEQGHTVFIDEPDNFIALAEIQPWLMAAAEGVEDHGGQLILISHHPELLNQWASNYGLRFFQEENGNIRTKPFEGDPDSLLVPAEMISRGW